MTHLTLAAESSFKQRMLTMNFSVPVRTSNAHIWKTNSKNHPSFTACFSCTVKLFSADNANTHCDTNKSSKKSTGSPKEEVSVTYQCLKIPTKWKVRYIKRKMFLTRNTSHALPYSRKSTLWNRIPEAEVCQSYMFIWEWETQSDRQTQLACASGETTPSKLKILSSKWTTNTT